MQKKNDPFRRIPMEIPIIGQKKEPPAQPTDQQVIELAPFERIKMTITEFIDYCDLVYGGLVYILREAYPSKVGNLVIPNSIVSASARGSTSGTILKMSHGAPFTGGTFHEHAAQQYFNFAPGDKVIFDVNVCRIIGKPLLIDMMEYPIQVTHVGDLHTKWNGPSVWDDNEEIQALCKRLRADHMIAREKIDWATKPGV